MTIKQGHVITRLAFPVLLLGIVVLTGCASTAPVGEVKYHLSDFEKPDAVRDLAVYDPLGPMNKELYRFNYYFDSYVFLPVVEAYRSVVPEVVRRAVSNFMDNIGEFRNFTNGVLQLKPQSAAISLSRFAVNSTVGILGLRDPASGWGLQRQDEDFGQTLGHYGTGDGPYLVFPALGPSNLRDTVGLVGDSAAFSRVDPLNFEKNDLEVPYYLLYAIDMRSRVPFRYFRSGSPFEYEFVRLFYTEKRKLQIAK